MPHLQKWWRVLLLLPSQTSFWPRFKPVTSAPVAQRGPNRRAWRLLPWFYRTINKAQKFNTVKKKTTGKRPIKLSIAEFRQKFTLILVPTKNGWVPKTYSSTCIWNSEKRCQLLTFAHPFGDLETRCKEVQPLIFSHPFWCFTSSNPFHTVDGRNPANRLGCIKPVVKRWDIYHINWFWISEPSTVSFPAKPCQGHNFFVHLFSMHHGCIDLAKL